MPEVNFVIAGGSNSKVFKDQGYEITSNIKFIGYVTDEELVALYKYAKCFVYPSIYEGFGIPPLEAIYFDCPVILSNIDVFHEIYRNSNIYVKDLNELKIKIKNIDEIDKLYSIKSKYRWSNNINILLKEIEGIL